MRRFAYEVLTAHGSAVAAEGDLSELLQAVPYLFVSGVIPPLEVVNDLLGKGIADRGMSGGCKWEPLQITREEWDELVLELQKRRGYRFVDPPEWVRTERAWAIWRVGSRFRIPDEEQRELERLSEEEDEWRRKSWDAARQGDGELMLRCHLKAIG